MGDGMQEGDVVAGDDWIFDFYPDDEVVPGSTDVMKTWLSPVIQISDGDDLVFTSIDGGKIITAGHTFGEGGRVVPATDATVPVITAVVLRADTQGVVGAGSRDLLIEIEAIVDGVATTVIPAQPFTCWADHARRA